MPESSLRTPISIQEAIKRAIGEDSIENKKIRLSASQTLVSSIGSDFRFSDREESFGILASSLEERFYCLKVGLKDKMVHKLAFLADGPGAGKSRFLQELSNSFVSYVKNLKRSIYDQPNVRLPPQKVLSYLQNTPSAFEDFKSVLSSALFINISFGSGSVYTHEEMKDDIQVSVCLRILYPYFAHKFSRFISFQEAYRSNRILLPNLSLDTTLAFIGKEYKCIVLGIDEVNVLHGKSVELFKELFLFMGSFSCDGSFFFVPVLAGTVIGPMQDVVTNSMYPPLHIPLPLLSFDSCLDIFAAKDQKYENLVKTDRSLRRAISVIGGHCRALEILFILLAKRSDWSNIDHWDNIVTGVGFSLLQIYPMAKLPLYGKAIAYSFLSLCVGELQQISGTESPLTFRDLEQYGLLKLQRNSNNMVQVKTPLIFVMCYLYSSPDNEYSKFWSFLLMSRKMYWQSWEEFNCLYMAFRISLFSKLGISTISLSEFLSGAKMNIPEEIILKIPLISDIKTTKSEVQYPSKNSKEFNVGTCVLNAPSAAFDAFVYLDTSNGKLLIAQQMKFASSDSKKQQKITDYIINAEYHKLNDSIAQNIPNTDFILLVLGRCDGAYHAGMIPSKCAVVASNEFEAFYGDLYNQYLNDSA